MYLYRKRLSWDEFLELHKFLISISPLYSLKIIETFYNENHETTSIYIELGYSDELKEDIDNYLYNHLE